MRQLSLIGAASGWGAGFRATQDGPPALRGFGIAERLQAAGLVAEWQAMIASERRWSEREAAVAPAEIFRLVARHNAALAESVAAAGSERLPIILGGDHSIAIGSWGGARRAVGAPLGLVWFDAHLDAHTPQTTPSMNPHGMSAAVLLGHGDPAFLAIGGGAVRPQNLCYIGARSYEAGELALLGRLGVRIIEMAEVARRGLDAVTAEALAIATAGTAAFGVTIDLDGFEPADAPGIGLKTENGLRRDDMLRVLAGIGRRPDLAAVEIVEYIPELDENERTAQLVQDLLLTMLAPAVARSIPLSRLRERVRRSR